MSKIGGNPEDYILPSESGIFSGAKTARAIAIIGAVVAVIGFLFDREQFYRSWLIAFMFWMGPALGSLAILNLQHITGGRWGTTLRRTLEAGSRTIPVMVLFFLPVVFGMHYLYEWTHEDVLAHDVVLQYKSFYLNTPFWLGRAAVFFALWIMCASIMSRWSIEQDGSPTESVHKRLHYMARGGICIYAISMTFAAVDWAMSLDPHWYSHIYGVITMGGQILTAMLVAILVTIEVSKHGRVGEFVTADRFHDLGKLTQAFIMLWAYFALSQFLIIWSGNLPEETPWYINRSNGGWQYVAMFLVAFHFVIPFVTLLNRDIKRDPNKLKYVVMALLFMRYVDLYWLLAPSFSPGQLTIHWLDFAAMAAIGGTWFTAFSKQIAGRPVLPLNDPYIGIEEA